MITDTAGRVLVVLLRSRFGQNPHRQEGSMLARSFLPLHTSDIRALESFNNDNNIACLNQSFPNKKKTPALARSRLFQPPIQHANQSTSSPSINRLRKAPTAMNQAAIGSSSRNDLRTGALHVTINTDTRKSSLYRAIFFSLGCKWIPFLKSP